jgi:hypothetical protein
MLELIKQRWASKTYKVGLLLAILSAIELNYGTVLALVPVEYKPYFISIWPIAMFLCREATNSALADK